MTKTVQRLTSVPIRRARTGLHVSLLRVTSSAIALETTQVCELVMTVYRIFDIQRKHELNNCYIKLIIYSNTMLCNSVLF